jgi:ketosteroid isomerase-like protein
MNENAELAAMLAERAITKVLFRYTRGVDRLDWDLVRSCFHPDAVLVYGNETTPEGFIEGAKVGLPTYRLTQHAVSNVQIEVAGDIAWSEAYCLARHRIPGAGGQQDSDFLWGGRYVDRFERRENEWRIARRTVVHEWTTIEPVPAVWQNAAAFTQGRRDREDIVYR